MWSQKYILYKQPNSRMNLGRYVFDNINLTVYIVTNKKGNLGKSAERIKLFKILLNVRIYVVYGICRIQNEYISNYTVNEIH